MSSNGHENSATLHVRVIGIGPSDFEGDIGPGWNELLGPNGAGKSNVRAALVWAFGGSMRPKLRHGAGEGFVEIDGQRVATLNKEFANVGDIELGLSQQSPIAEVIMPNVQDPKRAETRRVASLMELVDIKLTDEVLLTLCSDDDRVLEYALNHEPAIRNKLITDAADRLSYWAHYLKREVHGKDADEAQGRIDASKVEKPETLSPISSQEARLNYERAVGDHRQKQGEAEQRTRQVEQQKEIQATLGQQPDVKEAEAAFKEAETDLRRVVDERHAIEVEIAKLQQALISQTAHEEGQKREVVRLQKNMAAVKDALDDWNQRKAILDAPITGATQKDVDGAFAAKLAAQGKLQEAQATETYEAACVVVEAAQEEREAALKAFKHVEKIAQGVTRQLAKLFNEAGIPGLTVEDGVLQKVHADGRLEPVVDLSAGQRAKLLLPLLARHKFPYGIIVVPEMFHASLQPSARKEIGEVFAAGGWRVVVERPTDEEGLRVERSETTRAGIAMEPEPEVAGATGGASGVRTAAAAPTLKLEGGQVETKKRTRKAVQR